MLKIYLDACALNRLTDDQRQSRIQMEAEAVERIFHLIWKGKLHWKASIVLEMEIRRNPDTEKRTDVLALLSFAGELLVPYPITFERAVALESKGYGAFDALHLACAEQGLVDFLLTTDDRFIRQVARGLGNPTVRVLNPVDWLQEVQR